MFGKKWLGVLATALLITLPSAAFGADVIKLGVPGAHSGELAGYGLPALNAATIVVEAQNAKGGLLGKKIVLVPQDDQCKPELATNAATKLVTEDVRVAMGPTCSGSTKAALPILMDKKVITISPSATAPDITQSGKNPYFFRTTPSDDAQARLEANFALDVLGSKKIAIIHDKGDYGKGISEFVRTIVEESGKAEIVFFEGITPGGVDYSGTIQKVARSGADTIIFGGYYPEASKLVTAIRSKNLNINFIGPDGVKTEPFLQLAGKDAEGVFATSSMESSHLPAFKEATEAHEKRFGAPPGQFYYEAYSASLAIMNAIEKAGSLEPEALVKALRTQPVDTPKGTIHFDERGDAVGIGFAMFKVVDGKFVDQKFGQ